jgi:hypothetical protein
MSSATPREKAELAGELTDDERWAIIEYLKTL